MIKRAFVVLSIIFFCVSAHAQISGQSPTFPISGHATPVPMATLAGQVASLIAKQNFAGVAMDSATVNGALLSGTLTGVGGQLNSLQQGKADVASPVFTGTGTIPNLNVTGLLAGNVAPSSYATSAARTLADRFSDDVNVRDFGVKCDGTTDDTQAFQAALNAAVASNGRSLRVPDSGACIISSGLTATLTGTTGLYIHAAGGKHGVQLVFPANFSGTGIAIYLKGASPTNNANLGTFAGIAGLTFTHTGTGTTGTAVYVEEDQGVMDPSLLLNHLAFMATGGGSWAVGESLMNVNVDWNMDTTCFGGFMGTCVSYDSNGPIAVEHHISDLYMNASATSGIGINIGHVGMTASLQGFTIDRLSCTGGETCIQSNGQDAAVDEIIVRGSQIASVNGIVATGANSVIATNNYFLGNTVGVDLVSSDRDIIASNVFMQGNNATPVVLDSSGSGPAGGTIVAMNLFSDSVSDVPITLKNGTDYAYIYGNNCYEQSSCVDTSQLSSGYTHNVIGTNDASQQNTNGSPEYFALPSGTSGNNPSILATASKTLGVSWAGATYPLNFLTDGGGNATINPGPGTLTLGGGAVKMTGQTFLPQASIANGLPACSTFTYATIVITDARNTGEAAGNGTGALATCGSDGVWKVNGSPAQN